MAKYLPAEEARNLMVKAIEVMRQSVCEPRADGKASPLVGAILRRPDGSVDTACRGEMRSGDHAEYTVLERKNHDRPLDGSVLFATLEPCAPGSRAHPKLGCAERIVQARIAEVWVGIEDPDPSVDGNGIRYLRENGVAVNMFDRDLQEAIREENAAFIAPATERALGARTRPIISPTRLEGAVEALEYESLSLEALEEYRSVTGVKDDLDSAAFKRRLHLQGLLVDVDGRWKPSGLGVILFGEEPRTTIREAGLLATVHLAGGGEETEDFDGPQVLVPDRAMTWLGDRLPNPIDRSHARRRRVRESSFELVREGLVNALVHRDYGIRGTKCQLVVDGDIIIITSPGGPPEPITLEQMQSLSAPMLSRNPVLHYVFSQMELAEERGLGMRSMRHAAEKAGLPLPTYSWQAPYLVLTVYMSAAASLAGLDGAVLSAMSRSERAGWEWLAQRERTTSAEYGAAVAVPVRTALNHLRHLTELGLVRKQGSGRSTYYETVRR